MTFSGPKLMAVGLLFEESLGKRLAAWEHKCIEDFDLVGLCPQNVADEIWHTLESEQEGEYRSAAYWALGKLARPSDRNKFVNALREELDGNKFAVAYQLMIALDNLDEGIFSRSSVGVDEEELNRCDALAFLARNDKK